MYEIEVVDAVATRFSRGVPKREMAVSLPLLRNCRAGPTGSVCIESSPAGSS